MAKKPGLLVRQVRAFGKQRERGWPVDVVNGSIRLLSDAEGRSSAGLPFSFAMLFTLCCLPSEVREGLEKFIGAGKIPDGAPAKALGL